MIYIFRGWDWVRKSSLHYKVEGDKCLWCMQMQLGSTAAVLVIWMSQRYIMNETTYHVSAKVSLSMISCFYIETRYLMKLEGWHLVVISKESKNDSDYIANNWGTCEGESVIVNWGFHKVLKIKEKWMVWKQREYKQLIIFFPKLMPPAD